ncbi:MAG: acyl-CoA dehydrogenase family protein [Proteobacteria bacterium]|nr:acyl-CoA dehydrogenase family protein [Pseudomonadota bacterium]
MRYELNSEQRAFRDQVVSFVSTHLPADIAERVRLGKSVGKEDLARWTRILNEQGWAAPHWPVEHGGTGWSLVERHIFDVECRRAHAPVLSGFGFNMVGPAIIRFGSPEQKAFFLPRIRNADLWWCQGYSEPQAGSDLASVQMRAKRDGDDYVVSGQKIWTSAAEHADWIFCLTRTDPDVQQQKGISFLLVDMKSPGIDVKPLLAFNGKRLWNQVFFDSVRVPVKNRLGDENRGWTVAKSLLGDERMLVSRVAENKRIFSHLLEIMNSQSEAGVDLSGSGLPKAINEIAIRLQALETTSLRLLTQADAGDQVGAEPSMLKLKGSELVQAQDELLFQAVSYWALPVDTTVTTGESDTGGLAAASVGPDYAEFVASGRYHHRGYTIAGGSSEIQHNIIAKQVLGL